jgi:drug/metabolite transporter (DMT)-like permease
VLVPLFSAIPGVRPPGAKAPRWNAYVGAVLAFTGILLLTIPAASAGLLPDFSSVNIGDVLTLGCSIAFAFHCISLGHTSPRMGFQTLALLQIGFCTVFMGLSMPLLERPHLSFTPRLWVAFGISALLGTAAAFSIQSWAQSILPTTHTALILTLEPVFAWLTSFLIMGERLGMRPASGALMILAGIAITELVPQPHVATAHEG